MTVPQAHDSPAFMLFGDAIESAERARRLLAMPDSMLLRDQEALSQACRHDRAAFDYIAARVAALSSRRDADGRLRPKIVIALVHARMALKKAARGRA